MKPIEDLKTEHEAVKITLKVLDRILSDAEISGQFTSPRHLEELMEFFQVFVDQCHHSKEEELLFPALQEIGVSKEDGPIGVMLHEHQLGRDYVAKMKAALVNYNNGAQGARQDLIRHGKAYIKLLVEHIDKENTVLFPLAEKHLSSKKQGELWAGFEKIETDKIGEGKHEAFHAMIESLHANYLQ
jgi:hemerythrin-like domain-containing protein